jgi:D-glycero-D-manno-heptose 1,7-bisphosphate phosphatase
VKPAVFLDRDGTLIREVHYIASPEQVEILPGVPEALRMLARAGFARVVVTNQSAVGRGIITLDAMHAVQREVERRLADADASIDAFYLRAARDLSLDVAASWMVGDMLSDLLAGRNAGCAGSILVRTGHGVRAEPPTLAAADHVADDLLGATRHILRRSPRPHSSREHLA